MGKKVESVISYSAKTTPPHGDAWLQQGRMPEARLSDATRSRFFGHHWTLPHQLALVPEGYHQ